MSITLTLVHPFDFVAGRLHKFRMRGAPSLRAHSAGEPVLTRMDLKSRRETFGLPIPRHHHSSRRRSPIRSSTNSPPCPSSDDHGHCHPQTYWRTHVAVAGTVVLRNTTSRFFRLGGNEGRRPSKYSTSSDTLSAPPDNVPTATSGLPRSIEKQT